MKHLTPVNRKAVRVEAVTKDVVALQQPPQQPEPPHIPNGCSLVFSPGWEADRNGGTAGLCELAGGNAPTFFLSTISRWFVPGNGTSPATR